MSLERLAAGCLLPSFPGLEPPEWALRWVERGLGGFTLFAYNVGSPEQLAELTSRLGEAGELLLAIDEEGGDVTRLEAAHGSSYPGNLALGAVDDAALTADVGAAIAGDLARVGINLNLAPVADVNTNPDNPVIGVRSFGADPELVARHVAAFVDGTRRQGVAACAKHFPGHGDTAVDSHRDLPVVSGDLEAALLPFRAAVTAGVAAVMTGHLLVPELDDVPATVSRRIVAELLRGELGFDGLVIADALEMGAIARGVGVEAGAVQALAAGVDCLCIGHDLHEETVASVVTALVDAVESGTLAAARLEEAAGRVRATAARFRPTADGAPGREVGALAASRAVRANGPSVGDAPLVVELVPEANVAAGELAYGLADLLAGAEGVRLGSAAGAAELAARANGRRVVLVVRDAARHAWQREVAALLPDALVVETGLPGGLDAAVETLGAGRANLEAAVAALR